MIVVCGSIYVYLTNEQTSTYCIISQLRANKTKSQFKVISSMLKKVKQYETVVLALGCKWKKLRFRSQKPLPTVHLRYILTLLMHKRETCKTVSEEHSFTAKYITELTLIDSLIVVGFTRYRQYSCHVTAMCLIEMAFQKKYTWKVSVHFVFAIKQLLNTHRWKDGQYR